MHVNDKQACATYGASVTSRHTLYSRAMITGKQNGAGTSVSLLLLVFTFVATPAFAAEEVNSPVPLVRYRSFADNVYAGRLKYIPLQNRAFIPRTAPVPTSDNQIFKMPAWLCRP